MLTQEENELLTRVGPGTEMNALFRRFWLPALLTEEMPAPDSPPVRVTLLGEELVAFKDTQGRIGFLDKRCPHRLANLFWGRNEEGVPVSYLQHEKSMTDRGQLGAFRVAGVKLGEKAHGLRLSIMWGTSPAVAWTLFRVRRVGESGRGGCGREDRHEGRRREIGQRPGGAPVGSG